MTINNKRQTLRDDHPTSFFYHHTTQKTIISSPHLRSLQLFDRRKKHGIGHHLMWWWRRRRRTTQRACTLATDLKASNHIDLLPPWLAWCTPRGERVRAQFPHIHSLTHTHNRPSVCRMFQAMCMAKSAAAAAAAAAFATVPSPVYPPSILFSSKFKFCFYSKKKKKTTPTKHTAFVQKTLTGFLATRHQGCVLLKWYFDRQCNTYFTEQIFI